MTSLFTEAKELLIICTFHGTSFSDIEVVYKNQKGKLMVSKVSNKEVAMNL